MKTIKVTLFNVHGLNSHIELMCEYDGNYYTINRWEPPETDFGSRPNDLCLIPYPLCSTFSFEIMAEPSDIVYQWRRWYEDNEPRASIISNNCADAVLWFLETFSCLPSDAYEKAPTTYNHLALGIPYPSFFKKRVTLPGRVMDIAKAHFDTEQKQSEDHVSDGLEPEQWGCLVGVGSFF